MKICNTCNKEKSSDCYSKRSSNKDGLQDKCKECTNIYTATWYKNNKSKHIKNTGKNRDKYKKVSRAFIVNHLMENPCVDCGERNIFALDFDHVRGEKNWHYLKHHAQAGI